MRDGDIDYSKYTLIELEEALAGINRNRFPNNYANLRCAYRQLTKTLPAPNVAEHVDGFNEAEEVWPGPKFDENGRYVPNRLSSGERTSHVILSLLLLAYGSYGVWVNDFYIPARRGGLHLHDVPAWIMYGAAACACMVMLSVVIDHYDRRNNETYYRAFASVGELIGWSLFGVSLLWALVNGA